ncbi:MAG: Ca-activated chloride channel family protein, partial [Myxococcota bacterium]
MRRSTLLLTAVPATILIALAVLSEPTATQPAPAPSLEGLAALTNATQGIASFSGLDGTAPLGNDDIGLAVTLDRSSILQGANGTIRAEVTLKSTHTPDPANRVPTDLVVVIDASGSMEGQKIEEARHAAAELVASLTSADRFALVRYSGSAVVEIPLGIADAEARQAWSRQIGDIVANGSTNMQAGLDVGGALHSPQPGRARRTILISDGLPDSPHGLIDQARSSARTETTLTTVGIGDDYDERLMSQ